MAVTDHAANPLPVDLGDAFAELGYRLNQILDDINRGPSLEDARNALNEAGLQEACKALNGSVADIITALAAQRAADDELRILSEAVDSAVLEAEWALDDNFETEGNKTYLKLPDGDRKPMLADDRKAWKREHAAKHPTVVATLDAQRRGEAAAIDARDGVTVAERRHTASKYCLTAAVAQLDLLRTVLIPNGATR